MTALNVRIIMRMIQGEEVSFPVELKVVDAIRLEENEDGSVSVRLRLTDDIDTFSGFVCKTHAFQELLVGVKIRIDGVIRGRTDDNKVVLKITSFITLRSPMGSDGNLVGVVQRTAEATELEQMRLVDVDLSGSENYQVIGRIRSKTSVRKYDLNGGRMFTFVLMDDSASVRVKAFNSNCDRVFPLIVVGSMVGLSAFGVVISNKTYSSLTNDYELVVRNDTHLSVIHDAPILVIQPSFNFRRVLDFKTLPINELYDTIGVIKSIGSLGFVHERKSGKSLAILRLLFGDASGSIAVCLWNEMAEKFEGVKNCRVALKDFRLNVYQNMRGLHSVMGSEVFINPCIEEEVGDEMTYEDGEMSLNRSADGQC